MTNTEKFEITDKMTSLFINAHNTAITVVIINEFIGTLLSFTFPQISLNVTLLLSPQLYINRDAVRIDKNAVLNITKNPIRYAANPTLGLIKPYI